MGVSVMSDLTISNTHSINHLNLGWNDSWWKNNTLFKQLITCLSQQTQLEYFNFDESYLTSEQTG